MLAEMRTYKPYTRMWIYGFNVDESSIDCNLEEIKKAGIGGIELQVLYPVAMEGNIDFFSPEFFRLLNYLVDKADKLDLDVDLTLGSGWPLGAPFITKSMAPDILIPYQQDIIGPTEYSFDFTCTLSGKIVRAVIARMEDGRVIPSSLTDVTDYIHTTYISVWPWGEKIDGVSIGEGVYRLYLFVSNEYRQRVGKAAPNMDGYAMDHCRKDVTDLYLKHLGDGLLDHVDVSKIRAVFSDSIELTGSNWTKFLPEEFLDRRGYDISRYLPALWQDAGAMTPYIRADYYRTYGELMIENFFTRINSWAEKKGVLFRSQAHGTWGDAIDAYAASHIPEGETFGYGDSLGVNINHHRLAVSAGMMKNAPIVSNETYTWLRKPRFLETLAMMKRAADACFVDGINHIVNHGYSFYKQETFENLFYASSVISPHNTWWEYYPYLSSYIKNISKYMQNSRIRSRVAMLTPTSHIWATNIMAELHMTLKVQQHVTTELADSLAKAGYWFAFVNDKKIQEDNQYLELGGNQMEILIIPNISYINLDTLKSIETLADNIKIVFLDCFPSFCDTYTEYREKNAEIRSITERLSKHRNVSLFSSEEAAEKMPDIINPDINITNSDGIGYIIREDKIGLTWIFVANITEEKKEIIITYPFAQEIGIYDAVTDSYRDDYELENGRLRIVLEENQSIIIEEAAGGPPCPGLSVKWEKETVLSDFRLFIQGETIVMDELSDWEEYPGLADYSGKGAYETSFEWQEDGEAELVLERVHEVCEVTVNGQSAGVIWKKPYRLNITKYIQKGTNEISLTATNLLFNAALAFDAKMPKEGVSENWPYYNIVVEQQRKDKVDTFRERDEHIGLRPSGISGKVIVRFGKKLTESDCLQES